MAEPIPYVHPSTPADTTRAELDDLLRVLAESGVLRTLKGLAGQFGELTQIAVGRLNSPGGRNGLGSITVAAKAMMDLSPQSLDRILRGITQGLMALGEHEEMRGDPPGFFRLMGRMHRRDVRRGLLAVVVVLEALGRQLQDAREEGDEASPEPPEVNPS